MTKKYEFYKRNTLDNIDAYHNSLRPAFVLVSEEEIAQAESILQFQFPDSLKEFYREVGHGYMVPIDGVYYDKIMSPLEIAEYYTDEDISYPTRELFEDNAYLVFFDMGSCGYLTIHRPTGGIYFYDELIADTLEEFIFKMVQKPEYYLKFVDEKVS